MRRIVLTMLVFATIAIAKPRAAEAGYYVEYYRNNLFLGLAYHRVGCLTDWNTIQSGQEYDGFTYYNYCNAGWSAASVPEGEWFDWNYASGSSQLNTVGADTNWCYDTPSYQDRSNSCGYNVLTECNSDCWIAEFSSRQGWEIEIASGCWGSPPRSWAGSRACTDR